MKENKFDICIIGAGIIGLSIACKLSKHYKNIIVVDKEPSFGRHNMDFSGDSSGFHGVSATLEVACGPKPRREAALPRILRDGGGGRGGGRGGQGRGRAIDVHRWLGPV